MRVKELILTNFRSYDSLKLAFTAEKNCILGSNGTGKTNIIEAIYFMSMGRSFRKADNLDLIKRGANEANIYLTFISDRDKREHTISAVISSNYKVFAYDDEKVSSISKILGLLMSTYYTPSLVFFFQDEPENRRKLLDETLSQLSPNYLYAIGRYKKLLKERNAALAQDGDEDVILALRDQLINMAYRISKDRRDLIKAISSSVSFHYKALYGEDRDLELKYKTNCPNDDDQRNYVEKMKKLFEEHKSDELMKRYTLLGPHRDDMQALLAKEDIATSGSQGENRLATLSLKLALAEQMKKVKGENPIYLLDDVTSDLDKKRCENLLAHLEDTDAQIFITGTEKRRGMENYSQYTTDEDVNRR